jgi:exodeoxyribonuclease VII large subunit
MTDNIYTVSQLNREAKRLLAVHFLTVQVGGEISNLSQPSSGHIYFTLKDAQAQIRCAMFKGQQQRLRFKPANGNQVILTAQVSLYEPRGDYQLVVEHMEEAGDGALRQAFDRLKQKLLLEGLFEQERKQPLPLIPNRIGVITSPSGAAIHDILTVLKRRFPVIPVLIYPVAVQGEAAKFEITQALATANQRDEVDVIILGRGGGSLEDLWAFNEEIVARAIAASNIPVISAVGHEVDVSIADFVADYRAATPSAAAEAAVPHQDEWLNGFYSNTSSTGWTKPCNSSTPARNCNATPSAWMSWSSAFSKPCSISSMICNNNWRYAITSSCNGNLAPRLPAISSNWAITASVYNAPCC